tara:strand:+ start:1665 stop:1937 length:273 start_codon:yes stop_codon:yes gene_type:complete
MNNELNTNTNGYNSLMLKSGWLFFITDADEGCYFNQSANSNIAMIKISEGYKPEDDTRLIIETIGSSKAQVHYFSDFKEAQRIVDIATEQ